MSDAVGSWASLLGLSPAAPHAVVAAIAMVFIFVVVAVPCCTLIAYLERKIGADFQARVGPNRAGFAGLLQPIADTLKLLQKRSSHGRDWRETFWLGVQTMALFSTLAVIPVGSTLALVNTDMSAFLPFWAALVLAFGTMLLGLSQYSVPGGLSGIRMASQALAGGFPALITILCAGVRSGGFRWTELAGSQGWAPWSWTAFTSPFEFLAFVVFVASGLVLLGVAPFDGALTMSDVQGGVASRLTGERLGWFRMSRIYAFFLWSVISCVLYLGAWNLPLSMMETSGIEVGSPLGHLLEYGVLIVKTFVLMFVVIWVSRANPRVRSDQVTDLAWKVLSPISLVALAGSATWIGWRFLF